MKAPALELPIIGLGLAAGAAIVVYVVLKTVKPADAGRAAARAAGELAGGAVVGIGEAVGIPATDLDECERALAEGRTWDASFACPAGRFIRYVFGSSPAPEPIAPYSINPRDRT